MTTLIPDEERCAHIARICSRCTGPITNNEKFYIFLDRKQPTGSTITRMMRNTFGPIKCRDFLDSDESTLQTATFVHADIDQIATNEIQRLQRFLRDKENIRKTIIFLTCKTPPDHVVTYEFKDMFEVIESCDKKNTI